MKKLKVLDLFSGIGGFSLGLERTGGFETVAFCEVEEFPRRVLAKHWPNVPCYDDVKKLTAGRLSDDGISVDVITGGFPCQPFSTASRGRKVAEDLWPQMLRVVIENKPKFVIAENVQLGPISNAAANLQEQGYRIASLRIGADDCGAPHARSRWWLIAHSYDEGEFQCAIHAEVALLPELCKSLWSSEAYSLAIRVPDGLPTRVDEARRVTLGNAVLPQIPEAIGRAMLGFKNERA